MITGTLCWRCAKACGKCTWSQHGEPIRGWEAEATDVLMQMHAGKYRYTTRSYNVIACPEFIADCLDPGDAGSRIEVAP